MKHLSEKKIELSVEMMTRVRTLDTALRNLPKSLYTSMQTPRIGRVEDNTLTKNKFPNMTLLFLMLNIPVSNRQINKQTERFKRSFSIPIPMFVRVLGIGEILGIGVGMLAISLIFLILLIITGQFSAISAVWPASNVTKITTNLANSVVTGSTFMTLVIFFAAVGSFFVMLGLALSAIGKLKDAV